MPSSRAHRQQLIAELIARTSIRTQGELQQRLGRAGVSTTQATLSRDLREMGVAKSPAGYVLPGDSSGGGAAPAGLAGTMRRELASADPAHNLVVLRTRPGHANALAFEIDRARLDDVAGTIAGDDTIFLATPSPRHARNLADRLRSMAGLQ